MSSTKQFNEWLDAKRPTIWMDFVRMALGIFLFVKGLIFTANFQNLTENVQSMGLVYLAVIVGHYIYLIHTAGGLLLAFGAYTRAVCVLNLPILIGAVVFNANNFLVMDRLMELEIAITCLLGLIMFFIYGGGRYSLDVLRRRDIERRRSKLALDH